METGKQVNPKIGRNIALSTGIPVYLSTFSRSLLWLLPLAFLLIAFFLPLSKILVLTLNTSVLTSENLLLTNDMTQKSL